MESSYHLSLQAPRIRADLYRGPMRAQLLGVGCFGNSTLSNLTSGRDLRAIHICQVGEAVFLELLVLLVTHAGLFEHRHGVARHGNRKTAVEGV